MIFILFMRTYISWKTALNVSSEETSLLNTARKSPLPGRYNGDKLKDCFCKLFMATTQLQLRRWPKYRFSFADCWRGQASTSSTPAPRLGSQHCNDCMITHCPHCNQSHSPPSPLKHFFEPTASRSSLTKAMMIIINLPAVEVEYWIHDNCPCELGLREPKRPQNLRLVIN